MPLWLRPLSQSPVQTTFSEKLIHKIVCPSTLLSLPSAHFFHSSSSPALYLFVPLTAAEPLAGRDFDLFPCCGVSAAWAGAVTQQHVLYTYVFLEWTGFFPWYLGDFMFCPPYCFLVAFCLKLPSRIFIYFVLVGIEHNRQVLNSAVSLVLLAKFYDFLPPTPLPVINGLWRFNFKKLSFLLNLPPLPLIDPAFTVNRSCSSVFLTVGYLPQIS